MQKQMKNGIIFVVFLLLSFLLTLTPLITEKALFLSNEIEDASFHGLIFDDPTRVDHLQVTRRIENKDPLLYRYDIRFRYEGDGSSVRILGTPERQIYLADGAMPSKSKVKLKGEYDKINVSVFESLKLKDILEKNKLRFQPMSEMRIPLDETVGDYAFTLVENPVTIRTRTTKTLADVGVFLTNGKIEKFSDALGVKDKNIKPLTATKSQSGTYINSLELIDGGVSSRVSMAKTVSIVALIVSAAVALGIIVLDKKKLYPIIYIAMVIFMLALPSAKMQAPTNIATFVAFPVLGFVGYMMFKLMTRPKLQVKSLDFRQALGMAILVFVLSTYLFAVTKGFYL